MVDIANSTRYVFGLAEVISREITLLAMIAATMIGPQSARLQFSDLRIPKAEKSLLSYADRTDIPVAWIIVDFTSF